jgi:CubicO group peptidase (beta-lactamase class C family)
MSAISVETDPRDVGLDPDRLTRITAHFRRYVDDGLLPGWLLAVSRQGQVAYLDTYGRRDIEADLPIELDTIYRFYSMTKPVTTVAAMMLWEQGLFQLNDPIGRYLPEFADMTVYKSGSPQTTVTMPAQQPIRVWHLMSHTSGLTYGFLNTHPVDARYRDAGFDWGSPPDLDLAGCCEIWARQPLLFEPGTEWNYSVATDVLGRLIEVLSGRTLDEFLAEHVFGPLGMVDSGFFVPDADHDRLAALYIPDPKTRMTTRMDLMGRTVLSRPKYLSGGGGMVSTAADYQRFVFMLRNGGELDGMRLLGPRTLGFMTQNHLPGGADLEEFGRPIFAETAFDGVGFGLGFSVVVDPVKSKSPAGLGEFAWGGAASTAFWVDPENDITGLFLTQLLPSSTHPIRPEFRQLVSQTIVA